MGRHHAPEPQTETTLTKLRKLLHLPVRSQEERQPPAPNYGVGDDHQTIEWLRDIHEDRLPDLRTMGHQNWEYQMYRQDDRFGFEKLICGGSYGMSPSDDADAVAAAILADWLDWNSVPNEARHKWSCTVRRIGANEWKGWAE